MKIELSDSMVFNLADSFARDIHSAVVNQHLVLIGTISKGDGAYTRERIQEIRAAIRSIEDKWDRRSLVGTIGYLFKRVRGEKGTEIRGRDYVAKVMKFRAEREAEEAAQAEAA